MEVLRFYMPSWPGIDLQEGYSNRKIYSIVNGHFHKLTLHYCMELWQALLDRKQHELETFTKFAAI